MGGFTPFHYLHREEVLILTYHRFSESGSPSTVSAKQLEQHLKYLNTHTNPVSLDDVVESFTSGKRLPENPSVVTIDDGYSDAFEIAFPLLKEYEIPATLYAITEFLDQKIWLWTDLMRYAVERSERQSILVEHDGKKVVDEELSDTQSRLLVADRINNFLKSLRDDEKWVRINKIASDLGVSLPETPTREYSALNWDQARYMDANCLSIESHTVSHPILTQIGAEELKNELTESRRRLFEELGRNPNHFCYPNGAYDTQVREAVVESGYLSAVSTNYGFCGSDSDLFALKRIDGQPGIENFAQSVSGFETARAAIGM